MIFLLFQFLLFSLFYKLYFTTDTLQSILTFLLLSILLLLNSTLPLFIPIFPLSLPLSILLLCSSMYFIFQILFSYYKVYKTLSLKDHSLILSLLSILSSFIILSSLLLSQSASLLLLQFVLLFFSCIPFLFALHLLLLFTTKQSTLLMAINYSIDYYEQKKHIVLHMNVVKDFLFVCFKVLLTILNFSFFLVSNLFYTASLGIAKYHALKMHSQSLQEQYKSYFKVGFILLFSSICFIVSSIFLYYYEEPTSYSMIVGISIACYCFVDFILTIKEVIKTRKSKALEKNALLAISISSSLLCFVLTQTALTSFADESYLLINNTLASFFFGGLAALIGCFVMIESILLQKKTRYMLDPSKPSSL